MSEVVLPRNVHFMYEHALAHLELREGYGLAVKWDITDPWHLQIDLDGKKDIVLRRAAYVGRIGEEDSVYSQLLRPRYQGGKYNRTRSENQYLTHWIYPYKGKFHPQMIRALLNCIGARPGWKVADIFSGSGTALLECQLLGIDSLGIEVSPLCVLLARVKTQAWRAAAQIEEAVDWLTAQSPIDPEKASSRRWNSQEVADFVQVARMVTLSDVSRRGRDPAKSFEKNLRAMLGSIRDMSRAIDEFGIKPGNVTVIRGDSRDLTTAGVPTASIDAIVTSPPYSIMLDYVENDEHALTALGCNIAEIRSEFIGVRGRGGRERAKLYEEDMKLVFSEIGRVLKLGARAIIIVGNVTISGEEWLTTKDMVTWAESAGLRFDREMPKIVWGLYNVMKDERILFFTRID